MYTHTISQGYNDGVLPKTVTTVFTGQTSDGFDGVIAAGATNVNITVAWKNAAVQSLMLTSDQAVTVKTNNATTPGDTIALGANEMILYGAGLGLANPFTVDVGQLFVTNGGTTPANFKVRVLST